MLLKSDWKKHKNVLLRCGISKEEFEDYTQRVIK